MNALGSIKSNFSLTTSLANFWMCPYVPKNARRYGRWSLPTPMILPQLVLTSDVWEPGADISCHACAPWEVAKGAGRGECWFGQSCALFLPEYFPMDSCPPFHTDGYRLSTAVDWLFRLRLDWAHVLLLHQHTLFPTGPSWQPPRKDTCSYHTSPSVGIDTGPGCPFVPEEKFPK